MSDDILHDDFFEPDTRTLEERELDILRSWLIRPNWCLGPGQNMFNGYYEAVCVLAGVDPELSMGDREQGFFWVLLPGVREKYMSQPSQWHFDRALLEDLTYFSGLKPRGTRPLCELISHALDAGFEIPWLEVARSDAVCTRYLPKKAFKLKKVGISATEEKVDYRQSNREKAYKKWREDDGKKLRQGLGRDTFNEIVERDFAGFRFQTGRINQRAIARHVWSVMTNYDAAVAPAFDTVCGDIRVWFAELESD